MRTVTEDEKQWLKVAIYGQPGVGKSSLGVTAPRPMFLLSELQGVLHIRQAAARLGCPVPPILLMSELADYHAVLRALNGDRNAPFSLLDAATGATLYQGEWPETIVIDSLTDAGRLFASGDKKEKDGFKRWEIITERLQNLIVAFRNAPVHVVFLCLAEDRMNGQENETFRSIAPDLPTKRLGPFLASTCNIVGYANRREVMKDGVAHMAYGVMFSGPEMYLLKTTEGLRPREPSNVTRWLQALTGQTQAVTTETQQKVKTTDEI